MKKNYKKKKKKRQNYKLFILLLWLFATGIMLTTSSYAWFTSNRLVYIDALNVHVAAESGLEISANAIDWKSIITNEDLINTRDNNYLTSTNQLPAALMPVSTGKNVNNGFLEMYYGSVTNNENNNYILTSTRSIETNSNGESSSGQFIVFDLFFKTNKTQSLYLNTQSGSFSTEETSYGSENAVRFAFLIEGNVPESTNVNTIQNLNNATSNTTYIWEPNYDVHTLSGVTNAYEVYNKVTSTTGGGLLAYDGVINEINTGVDIRESNVTSNPNLFKEVIVDYATVKDFTVNEQIFAINEGITKIRVYIWIEGQDVDCEDNASVGDINFNLQLTINPA